MRTRRQQKIPYEKAGERWKEYTRPYREVIHLSMSLRDRELWVQSNELSDFRVFACGCYAEAWNHYWKRKGINEGVCIYCVAGKGYYRRGARSWTITPGELLYCHPDTAHEYRADATDPWTIYWLHISGPRIGLLEKQLGVRPGNPVVRVGRSADIIALFRLLFSFFADTHNRVNQFAIQSCAANILATMALYAHSKRREKTRVAEVETALRFMDRALFTQAGVDEIAKQAGVSTFHFCRIFKKAMGVTPINYFNHLKIRKACTLLAGSTLKIKEIAFKLAFDDPFYFSRLFKKIMGLSPEQYRDG